MATAPIPKARASKTGTTSSTFKAHTTPRELEWLTRQHTTKCISYQGRKKRRVYTPKKIGAIVCAMVEEAEGQSRFSRVGDHQPQSKAQLIVELRAEISQCFALDQREQQAEQQALAAAQALPLVDVVADFVRENQTMLTVSAGVLGALLFLPRVIAVLPRAALVLFPVAARTIISQIPGTLARIEVQQAANASFLRIVAQIR